MNAHQIISVGRSLTTKGGRTRLVFKTLGGFIWKGFTAKRIALAAALIAGGLLAKQMRSTSSSIKTTVEKAKTEATDAVKKTVAHASSSGRKTTSRTKAAHAKKNVTAAKAASDKSKA